jgi:Holliday junction resolvasome RuvABC ATP-dependent DNA helicase subunit
MKLSEIFRRFVLRTEEEYDRIVEDSLCTNCDGADKSINQGASVLNEPIKQTQTVKIFFGPGGERPEPPSHEEMIRKVDRDNPESPFYRFVGNEQAISKLQRAAYSALCDPFHAMNDLAFAIYGPSSAGKTTLARMYADCVGLPFVEVSPLSIKKIDDLFEAIAIKHSECGSPLVQLNVSKTYLVPPCVVLLDEVHALPNKIVQGLLKATEFNDAMMVTESGKQVNMKFVTWMIATTDEGRLFDAFRTRFSPIVLKYLTRREIAQVVKLANPDLPDEVCKKIAYYNSRIPRKALMFARDVRNEKNFSQCTWEEAAKCVAKADGIDQFGMHETHLKVLLALKDGPVASKRMVNVTGRKEEENENFIMPWLLTSTEDQEALVTVTSKGYAITSSGEYELYKRGLHA